MKPHPIPPRLVTALLLATGVILRLAEYLEGRSLWLDETFLSLNVIDKPLHALFGRLDYQQGAPVGFLLLQKLAVALFGTGELALRLVPFLAGCATLVFGGLLATRWMGPSAGLVPLVLLVLCDPLVSFSAEAKQYGFDACVTVALLWSGLRALQDRSRPAFVLLAAMGALLVWFSHPAIFVLAGIGAMLAVEAWRARDRAAVPRLGLVGAAWAAGFFLCWAVSLRHLAANPFFLDFWAPSFVPPSPDLSWFGRRTLRAFANLLDLAPWPPLFGLWLGAGVVTCAVRRPLLCLAGVVSGVAATAASAMHLYPISERFLMFFVPIAVLFLSEALVAACRGLARPGPWAGAIVLAAAFAFPAFRAARELSSPRVVQDFKPVLAHLQEKARPDDWIYVFHLAAYPWRYYADRYGFNGAVEPPRDYADPAPVSAGPSLVEAPGRNPILLGTVSHFTSDGVRDVIHDLRPLLGKRRVWVVISHGAGGRNAGRSIPAYLDRVGHRLDSFRTPGAWGGCEADLYDLGGALTAAPPEAGVDPADPEGLLRAALDARRTGDIERSLRLFERLEAFGPLRGEALFARAQVFQLYGDGARAADDYRAVLESEPGNLRARFFLGEALEDLGRCVEAITAFRQALATRPDLDGAREGIARCRMRLRR